LICHFTDRLIQLQLWLTHQEPITVGDGTRSGYEDRVDLSSADGAYQGKATDGRVGERLLKMWHHTDKRCSTGDHIVNQRRSISRGGSVSKVEMD
jgi:hypothetical protein